MHDGIYVYDAMSEIEVTFTINVCDRARETC